MRRGIVLAGTAAVLLLGIAGCTASSGGSTSSSDGSAGSLPAPAADGAPDTSAIGTEAGVAADASRDVVITGYLDLLSEDPLAAASRARGIVTGSGGRLDGYTETPANGDQPANAQLTARIPSDRLDETVESLRELGDVRSLSTTSSDVTQQTTDLDARITSLQASVDRLRTLLGTATTASDLVAVETTLSEREADLESLTAQRTALADQVDYATLSVTVSTPGITGSNTPSDFWGGLVAGFRALVAALGFALVALGAALPWLVFLAVVGAVVFGIVRAIGAARRRRRLARVPDASADSGPERPVGDVS